MKHFWCSRSTLVQSRVFGEVALLRQDVPKIASGFDDDDTGRCPECGAEVYLIAGRCPKCGHWFSDDDDAAMRSGHDVRGELRVIKIAGAILLAVAVVGVVAAVLLGR